MVIGKEISLAEGRRQQRRRMKKKGNDPEGEDNFAFLLACFKWDSRLVVLKEEQEE